MKKSMFLLFTLLVSFWLSSTVFAAPSFDKTQTAKGILTITYDGVVKDKTIKLKVENLKTPTTYYTYSIKTNKPISVPLQLGDGNYQATLLEGIGGNRFKVLSKESFSVAVKTPNDMFLSPSPFVDFNKDMEFSKGFAALFVQNKANDSNAKINTTYEEVVNRYSYDTDKAKAVVTQTEYLPVIDDTYKNKKGICFDYAAIMAGVLRQQQIPTRLVMGYAPEIDVYHAWNEIYKDGKWIVVDTTYDAAYAQANQKYSMEKDAKLFKVLKTY